jgi:hypothetical protein
MSKSSDEKWAENLTSVPMLVGMVANAWAELEHNMVHLANGLLRTRDYRVGKIVMFSASPPQRRDLLLALVEVGPYSKARKDRVREFCTEFERLRKLRNDIVHGYWDMTDEDDPVLRLTKSRAQLKETLEPKEVKWILDAYSSIKLASNWAIKVGALVGWHAPSPQKPPSRRKSR